MLDYYFCEQCETYHLPNRIINGQILSACECEIKTQPGSQITPSQAQVPSSINQHSKSHQFTNPSIRHVSNQMESRIYPITQRIQNRLAFPTFKNQDIRISKKPFETKQTTNKQQQIRSHQNFVQYVQQPIRTSISANIPPNRVFTRFVSPNPHFQTIPFLEPPHMIQVYSSFQSSEGPIPHVITQSIYENMNKSQSINEMAMNKFEKMGETNFQNSRISIFTSTLQSNKVIKREQDQGRFVNQQKRNTFDLYYLQRASVQPENAQNSKQQSTFTLQRVSSYGQQRQEQGCLDCCE